MFWLRSSETWIEACCCTTFLLWNKLKASVYLLSWIKIKWLKCLFSLGNNFLFRVCSPESRTNKFHVKQAQSHHRYSPSPEWTPCSSTFMPEKRAGGVKGRQDISHSLWFLSSWKFIQNLTLQRHEQSIQIVLESSSWNHVSDVSVKKLYFQEQ